MQTRSTLWRSLEQGACRRDERRTMQTRTVAGIGSTAFRARHLRDDEAARGDQRQSVTCNVGESGPGRSAMGPVLAGGEAGSRSVL
jgi:hypothetical protein